MSSGRPAGVGGQLFLVAVFAVATGWLEAVIVVYIRGLLGVGPGHTFPAESEFVRRFLALPWLLPTEQSREAATLVMLASLAWLAGSRLRSRLGAFLVTFGLWDIVYYGALWVLLRWPPSLATKDLLFLIPPGPWWYQPVWLPVAVSCLMIAAGTWLFLRPRPSGKS